MSVETIVELDETTKEALRQVCDTKRNRRDLVSGTIIDSRDCGDAAAFVGRWLCLACGTLRASLACDFHAAEYQSDDHRYCRVCNRRELRLLSMEPLR